jgi:hypothetical protein
LLALKQTDELKRDHLEGACQVIPPLLSPVDEIPFDENNKTKEIL